MEGTPTILPTSPSAGTEGCEWILQQLDQAVWQADANRERYLFIGSAARALLGYPLTAWLNEGGFWRRHVHPDDRETVLNAAVRNWIRFDHFEMQYRFQHADGHYVWLRDSVRLVRRSTGIVGQCGVSSVETCSRVREDALASELGRLQVILQRVPALVCIVDANWRLEFCGGGIAAEMGIECDTAVGMPLETWFNSARDGAHVPEACARALRGEIVNVEHSWRGRAFHVRVEPLQLRRGEPAGCLVIAWEITDRKQLEQQARFYSLSDPLTGLANYRRLIEVLIQERQRSDRSGREFTLLLLDMDGLKRINDIFGHRTGTRALCRLARILRENCRTMDLAARYGGDEFAMVLPETDYLGAQRVVQRITQSLRSDLEVPPIMASIGIAIYPADAGSAQQLLDAADRDLYRRKHAAHSNPRDAGRVG